MFGLSLWIISLGAGGENPSHIRLLMLMEEIALMMYLMKNLSASGAYVGLVAPEEVGSWQRESKGYQFWTRTDDKGHFIIDNIRLGNYNLYAWVPGFIGYYKYNTSLTVTGFFWLKISCSYQTIWSSFPAQVLLHTKQMMKSRGAFCIHQLKV
ncbi:hypothetical protein RND81_13G156300 [Saponaria officinalis]|uniref:Rhamnogalacturonan lyase domain-containing protein n=1 Tax=Saponaria officinalis TaxID=3572 RepID=A0AAW1H1W4_SAPOF